MKSRIIGFLAATFAVAAMVPASPLAAQGSGTATCVGGALGCSQVDFYLQAPTSALPLTLRTFSITLTSGYRFNDPAAPYLELQDATGFDIADATIDASRTTLTGTFSDPAFYALLNSSYPYLRVRTDFSAYSTIGVAPGFTFVATDPNGTPVLSGVVPAPNGPSTTVPEPATLALLGIGLAGVAAARARREAA